MKSTLRGISGLLAPALFALPLAAQLTWAPLTERQPIPADPLAVWDAGLGRVFLVLRDTRAPQQQFSWDGFAWRATSGEPGFSFRESASMVHADRSRTSLVFGGIDAMGPLDDTWRWDGSTWIRVATATSPAARWSHAMAVDPIREEVVLFGGLTSGAVRNGETWVFANETWTRRHPAHAPAARLGHSMAWDPATGRVLLFGGASTVLHDDTWVWDGQDWTELQPAHRPPGSVEGALSPDRLRGRLLFTGGRGPGGGPAGLAVWHWDGSDWMRQATVGAEPEPRYGHAMVHDALGDRLVLFGGRNAAGDPLADTWTWDPASGGWESKVDPTSLGIRAGLVTDEARGRALMHLEGPSSRPGSAPPRTLAWDGARWTELVTAHVPSRADHTILAYDSSRARVIKVGFGFGDVDETWSYDGNDWTRANPTLHPTGRQGAAGAFDRSRGQLVLFGGLSTVRGGGLSDETWTFDGAEWQLRQPPVRPAPRYLASMGYDPVRGVTVLFGGRTAGSQLVAETWEWDGSSWSQRTPAHSPPGLWFSDMDWDPTLRRLVVCGYDELATTGGNRWEWDGLDWRATPIPDPSQQYNNGFATWEPIRGQMLFHGAQDSSNSQRQTWTLTDTAAASEAYGSSCGGGTGCIAPELQLSGRPSLATGFRFELVSASPSAPAVLALSLTSTPRMLGGCTIYYDPATMLVEQVLGTDIAGVAVLPIVLPLDPALRGVQLHAQAAALDASTALGLSLSRGLRIDLGD